MDAVRRDRESDQERRVPEVEGGRETHRWPGSGEEVRPGARPAEIVAARLGRGRRGGIRAGGGIRRGESERSAAALFAGIGGALRERLGSGDSAVVTSAGVGRVRPGGARMGDRLRIRRPGTERLADGRPRRPEQKQRDEHDSHPENHPNSTRLFTRGPSADAGAVARCFESTNGRRCRWRRIGRPPNWKDRSVGTGVQAAGSMRQVAGPQESRRRRSEHEDGMDERSEGVKSGEISAIHSPLSRIESGEAVKVAAVGRASRGRPFPCSAVASHETPIRRGDSPSAPGGRGSSIDHRGQEPPATRSQRR
jgi:hypothetical protein